jgi:excisionase family DNA binding protein
MTVVRILDAQWDGRSTFTVEESGRILGLSKSSAWSALRRGELPFVKIGNRYIVPRVALERLLSGAGASAA